MTSRLLMVCLVLAACTTTPEKAALRYDGYYEDRIGQLVYMVRFFPDQRAVLINGTEAIADSLPQFLVTDAIGDPTMGWYNVPMRSKGDSLFFTTRPERGEIDYRGIVLNDSVVRFERYSHINGDVRIKEYRFKADH